MPDDHVDNAPDPRNPAISANTPNADSGKFRGPLRYEIETSSSILEAGRMFSIFLRITNPYDVPVTISSVDTQLPVEFFEPYGKRPARGSWQKFKQKFGDDYTAALVKGTQTVSAKNLSAAQASTATVNADKDPAGDAPDRIKEARDAEANVLQPGNSILKEFTVRTLERNTFTPSVYWLHMQISYEMDGKLNHDTAKTALNIKAPISAMAYGAVLGAVIGTFLRHFQDGKPALNAQLWVSMFTSVLIGLVMVIAFARKKDAQPFITIEDFYGGAFIGVIAGLTGYSLLDQLLGGTAGSATVHGPGATR